MATKPGKITVVGSGFYGSTTALRLAQYDVVGTVVLTDVVEGKPEGLALDLNSPARSRASRPRSSASAAGRTRAPRARTSS